MDKPTDNLQIQIWNDQQHKVAGSLELKAPVLGVRASKEFLVVVLPFQVNVYRMGNPPQSIQQYDTLENFHGLCSFENNIVATLAINPGHVRIIRPADGDFSPRVTFIPAHNTRLRAVALNKKGDMVATASEKGTIIRVFAVESGTKIAEFRRGMDEAAIFSLAFSPHDKMLAVTSDKSTVHIFMLPNGVQKPADIDPKTHKYGFLAKVPLLPRPFSDMYSSASAHFEMGDELGGWTQKSKAGAEEALIKYSPERVPTKGLLGWLDDSTFLIIGAGQDARWEKFVVNTDETGKVFIRSVAWKNYLD